MNPTRRQEVLNACHSGISGHTTYCGARVYAAQKGNDKEDEEVSPVSVLLRAGLSLETQWAFMQLGIPGGFMMAAEASSFDVTTALAGLLGAPSHLLTVVSQDAMLAGTQQRVKGMLQARCSLMHTRRS